MKSINIKNKQSAVSSIIFGLFIISFLTFVFTPMTGDLKVFTASAKQADYVGKNWIYNAYNTWELKSVFSRLYIYLIYKIVLIFTRFGNYHFEVGFNFTYALIAIILFMVVVHFSSTDKSQREKNFYTMLLSITIFATIPHCHMQVEMTCMILILLAFSLYVNAVATGEKTDIKLLFAGILIGSLFFFKSVLLLMSVSFVAAGYLWGAKRGFDFKWKYFLLLVAGSIIMLILGVISIILINPEEIQNILDAAVLQPPLFKADNISLVPIIIHFGQNYLYNCVKLPAIFIGIVAAAKNFAEDCLKKNKDRIFIRIILWLFPATFVILSNKYFPYHYLVFLFPSIIELSLIKDWLREQCMDDEFLKKIYIMVLIIFLSVIILPQLEFILFHEYLTALFEILCFVFIVGVMICSLLRKEKGIRSCILATLFIIGIVYFNYISIFSMNCRTNIELDKKAYNINEDRFPVGNTKEMLYLDDGKGAYLLGAKSYLKYFFPLPLQRINENSEDSNRKCYTESFDKIMGYDGQYISVQEKWFFGNEKNKAIKEKINYEYKKIDEYAVYSPSSDIFFKNDESRIAYYDLYERKLK